MVPLDHGAEMRSQCILMLYSYSKISVSRKDGLLQIHGMDTLTISMTDMLISAHPLKDPQ